MNGWWTNLQKSNISVTLVLSDNLLVLLISQTHVLLFGRKRTVSGRISIFFLPISYLRILVSLN